MLGGLDRSVPTAESARLLRQALTAAGNRDATVRCSSTESRAAGSADRYDRETRQPAYYVPGFQDGLIHWIEAHVRGHGH